jgi:cell division protein FtsW
VSVENPLDRRPVRRRSESQRAGSAAEVNASRRVATRLSTSSIDRWVLISVVSLVAIGVIMVTSASVKTAYLTGSFDGYLTREIMFVSMGIVLLLFGALFDYRHWTKVSPLLVIGVLAALAAVLIIGKSANGAQRWFPIAGQQIQPSEFAKVGLVIYIAHWLSHKGPKITSFRAASMPFGILLGVVCFLIIEQPDLGTCVVVALSLIVVYYAAGAKLSHLGLGLSTAFLLAAVVISHEAYQTDRFLAWLDPTKYSQGAGYHITQSLQALGRGGPFGVGLGNSIEKYTVPAPYTDTIFAVLGEELGLIGTLAILGLFVVLLYRGVKVAREAPDEFGRLLAIGLTVTLVIQAFLNIAVVTDTVPFTGVPLPFISFGGSSLLTSMLAAGILLNISRQSTGARKPRSLESEMVTSRSRHVS